MSEFEGSTLYYFKKVLNKENSGRGESVRILLEDSGLKFEYKTIEGRDWLSHKMKLMESGNRFATMPYVVTKSGKLFSSAAPLLRAISKDLGKYIPKDAEGEYLVDAYADSYLDWRTKFVYTFNYNSKNLELQQDYREKFLPNNYAKWNDIFSDKGGPYALGEEITYVDFMVFTLLRDEVELKIDEDKYPNIVRFIKAFEARPSLQHYFEKIQ